MVFNPVPEGKIILRESFNYPDGKLPASWWSEGCSASIKKNRLFVDADTASYRSSTIWLDLNLSGDVQIDFDVRIVSSSDTANNINCFFMYSHPDGNHLRNSFEDRISAEYKMYHNLNGYIFTAVANGDEQNARFRFRDNPGFNILAENFTGELKIGKRYHIRIMKISNRFQYWKDGIIIIDAIDDKFNPVCNSGLFGFRTWHTSLWWDNLVITRLD